MVAIMSDDLRLTFTNLHRQTIEAFLGLLDGFYENLEAGLLELADRLDDDVRSRCLTLMREMREQRSQTCQRFAHRLAADESRWIAPSADTIEQHDELVDEVAITLVARAEHFRPAIEAIAQRTATATGRDTTAVDIPIAPHRLTYQFLSSCHQLKSDRAFATMVGALFGRFVLDGLGPIYGQCNERLAKSGFELASAQSTESATTNASQEIHEHAAA
jgi:hypothetical protein